MAAKLERFLTTTSRRPRFGGQVMNIRKKPSQVPYASARQRTEVAAAVLFSSLLVASGCGSPDTSEGQPYAEPTASAVSAIESTTDAEDYVRTPNGTRVHKSCVFSLPPGGGVGADGDIRDARGHVVRKVAPCLHAPIAAPLREGAEGSGTGQPAQPNGNVEYETAHPANTSFTWFNALEEEFIVPNNPPCAICGSQDVLWEGFASRGAPAAVLQPIINFGPLPPGCSGNTGAWNLLNYYIDQSGNAYCGALTQVSPGDAIETYLGVDTGQPCSNSGVGCSWVVFFDDVTSGVSAGNEAYNVPFTWDTAVLASLELYNASKCGDLPSAGGYSFFEVQGIWVPGPQWNNFNTASSPTLLTTVPPPFPPNVATNCGYQVSVAGTGVALFYHN
jgi:hypothetical protein